MALSMLAGCGGGGGAVNSTPPPPIVVAPPPPPPPPPPPAIGFATDEYLQSNAVIQSGAITAYQAGATGQGVTAAIIDSGIAAGDAEFAGRIHAASADLAGTRGLQDEGGHGSAVAGVLAAAKNDSGQHGIAFNATLLIARTDTPGSCANTAPDQGCSHNDNAIARGVDLAVANRARVINISLGGSPANSTLRAAIGRATSAGVVIVISAGNDATADPDPLAQIANDPLANNLVIIAGGLDSTNAALASFSDKAGNSAIHYLGALGSRVRSIDETGAQIRASGTSFSAPSIAGAVVLLAQAFPNLTGAQIVDLLFRSATDLGASGVDAEFGRGALNIARAFQPQGGASLAGSLVPVTLGQSGITSAAIGDGGQTGASAVILDGYGRAFDLALGGFRRSGTDARLAQGLGLGAQLLSAAGGATAISLSVAPGGGARAERLLLSGAPSRPARALAGSVITRLGAHTSLALGISSSGIALARDLEGGRSPAFLAGNAAGATWGFDTHAKSGLALARQLSGFAFTLSAESGVVRLWDNLPQTTGRVAGWQSFGYSAYRIGAARAVGPVRISVAGSWLSERDTVLGSRLGSFYSAGGAQSLFADGSADWQASRRLRLSAAWRQGWTRVAGGSLHPSADVLRSTAWSIDATRAGLFTSTDSFALRLTQPLRIARGGLNLRLPTTYDYASGVTGYGSGQLNLAPKGREIDAEGLYTRPFAGGTLSGNLYWRRDPGNFASAPDDLGVALRFTRGW